MLSLNDEIDISSLRKADLIASLTKNSFYDFVREFWDEVCAEVPIWNWHIEYLCNLLQEMAFNVRKKQPLGYDYLVVNISPGSTKSLLISVMFQPWVWTWWPSASFVGSAYNKDLAVRMSRLSRTIVKSNLYQQAFPNVRLISDQDTKSDFANSKKGERMTVGVEGNITGRHGDFVFCDDPLNPKGARSEADLEGANLFILETLRNRKKDKTNVPTIIIMQRLHENDPSGMLISRFKKDVKHICIPAEITNTVNPPELKKYYKDGLMDPNRLPKSFLEKEKIVGDFYYAGQYLQNPVPLGGGMFKAERMSIEESLPKEFSKVVRYWDKGGTKDGGCYTVGVKMGIGRDETVWIIDVKRGQWDAAQREKIIKHTAIADGKNVIIGIEQEGGSGGKESAENSAKNLGGYKVRLDRPTGDKAARADPYATQVNAHNVIMLKAEWNFDYMNELSYFPESTYKDQVDASSGAYKIINQPEIIIGCW